MALVIEKVTNHADIPEKDQEVAVRILAAKFAEFAKVIFEQHEVLGLTPVDSTLTKEEREQVFQPPWEFLGLLGNLQRLLQSFQLNGPKRSSVCPPVQAEVKIPTKKTPKRADGTEEAKVFLASGRTPHQEGEFPNFDCFRFRCRRFREEIIRSWRWTPASCRLSDLSDFGPGA